MLKRRKNTVTHPPGYCPLTACMKLIGGAWTPYVIWYLSANPRRFSELKDDIKGISAKVLTQRLRKLEADGVIQRKVVPTSPPSVEYALTDLGKQLGPIIQSISAVGEKLKPLKVKSEPSVKSPRRSR